MARVAQGGHFVSDVLWAWGIVHLTAVSLYYLMGLDREQAPPSMLLKNSGCSKIVISSHPQEALRRRSCTTPHEGAFEDGGEMAVFQQPS